MVSQHIIYADGMVLVICHCMQQNSGDRDQVRVVWCQSIPAARLHHDAALQPGQDNGLQYSPFGLVPYLPKARRRSGLAEMVLRHSGYLHMC